MKLDPSMFLATLSLPAVAVLLACSPLSARALTTTVTSEAAWQASVIAATTINFDDLPDGTAVGLQYQPLGATFASFNGGAPVVAAESAPYSLPHMLSVDAPAGGGGGVEVSFSTLQAGVGLWYSDSQFAGNLIVLYRAADQVLASYEMAWPHPTEWLFVGFTSDIADIARVEVSMGDFDRVTLDDFQFAVTAVPEPAPLALLLAGGLLVAWRINRQAVAVAGYPVL